MKGIDTEVIGKGYIGSKAEQLLEKTPGLAEIGFNTPKRIILAEDYFDGFFQRNGLGTGLRDVEITEDLEGKIKKGSLTKVEFETLQRVSDSYGNSPLAVRSSAAGDARGTGIYVTNFTGNVVSGIRYSLLDVLASYFSNSAVAFRRDADTGEGFGIIIEPIIGQELEGSMFAPVLSGFGYTSTSRGDAYINVVPGLGGGVETRDGERMNRASLEESAGSLFEYSISAKDRMNGILASEPTRKTAILNSAYVSSDYGDFELFNGQVFIRENNRLGGKVYPARFELPKVKGGYFDVNLLPFFDMIKQMEEKFGKPQYFEWAMTLEDGQPRYWITQIADVDKKLDLMDFGDIGDIIFEGHTVTGTDERECSKIAYCFNPDDIDSLREFNQRNTGYVLLFHSKLTSAGLPGISLTYRDYSNASVFLEQQGAAHVGDPVAHLEGQVDETGKLFAVLDYRPDSRPNWDLWDSKETENDRFRVYQGRVKVIASERQNRMVISALD